MYYSPTDEVAAPAISGNSAISNIGKVFAADAAFGASFSAVSNIWDIRRTVGAEVLPIMSFSTYGMHLAGSGFTGGVGKVFGKGSAAYQASRSATTAMSGVLGQVSAHTVLSPMGGSYMSKVMKYGGTDKDILSLQKDIKSRIRAEKAGFGKSARGGFSLKMGMIDAQTGNFAGGAGSRATGLAANVVAADTKLQKRSAEALKKAGLLTAGTRAAHTATRVGLRAMPVIGWALIAADVARVGIWAAGKADENWRSSVRNVREHNFVTSLPDSGSAATNRQRALESISNSRLNARSAIGGEAQFLAGY